MANNNIETATLAGGCFWCTEALFLEINGIISVTSGYMGGHTVNPTYKEVCTGDTGHAEVIEIVYNPEVISFQEILEIFFVIHNPTTLNRQGADVGTQYRSEIFYHSELQKQLSEEYIKYLSDNNYFEDPIVTQISPATIFYKAEDYHQNYYANNTNPYCDATIPPKMRKLKEKFNDKLK